MTLPETIDRREAFQSETVGVYGFGRTGQAVVEALHPYTDRMVVLDDAEAGSVEYDEEQWPGDLEWRRNPAQFRGDLDRLIVSPGVPGDHPYLRQVRETGRPVWGEQELAYRIGGGTVLAITGTNGKSSCTQLAGDILRTHYGGDRVSVCGNHGRPFLSAVVESDHHDPFYVVEVSSFQLEGFERFEPDGSLLINLGDDHQDRHESLREYHGLKWQLLKRTHPRGATVAPRDVVDSIEPGWLLDRPGFRSFSRDSLEGTGTTVGREGDVLLVGTEAIDFDRVPRLFRWFPENLMGVVGLVEAHVDPGAIRRGLEEFSPLPYRASRLDVNGGPSVYNDSKATNPHAVEALLDRIQGPFRLVLGGGAKQADFGSLVDRLRRRKPAALRLCGDGTAVQELRELCDRHQLDYEHSQDWEQGVKETVSGAGPEEAVLLSPGGTSFDAFRDYRHRGERFEAWTREVLEP